MSVNDFRVAPLGLLTATLDMSNGVQTQKIAIVVSRDGQYLVQGTMTDLTVDPFKATMEKISLTDVPARGSVDAPVTIVEYSDFQCPFCKEEAKVIRQNLISAYPKEVRLYFKDFPLEQIHPWAVFSRTTRAKLLGSGPEKCGNGRFRM